MKRIKDLSKLPKGNVSVDDVLKADNFEQLIELAYEHKATTRSLLFIQEYGEDDVRLRFFGMDNVRLLGLLEFAKWMEMQE